MAKHGFLYRAVTDIDFLKNDNVVVPTLFIVDDVDIIQNKIDILPSNELTYVLKVDEQAEKKRLTPENNLNYIGSSTLINDIKALNPEIINSFNPDHRFDLSGDKIYNIDFTDDKSAIKEIAEMFVLDSYVSIKKLSSMYENSDFENCMKVAHKTKSHFLIFNVNPIFYWLNSVENYFQQNSKKDIYIETAIELIIHNADIVAKQLAKDYNLSGEW
ncbi:MAG: hypothetical protein PHP31_04700 [Lentimicrobiaceae bacterium]|nr:hypothetical protein [Lentimicrobiaceae bacterium]